MCAVCEGNDVNTRPSDNSFKLTAMCHGSTGEDLFGAATVGQKLDRSEWKEEGVMFVFENPGALRSQTVRRAGIQELFKISAGQMVLGLL